VDRPEAAVIPAAHPDLLGSRALGRVLADLRLTCVDVGARGGVTADLLPLAAAVDAVAIEPDRKECARLNATARRGAPWRRVRFIPTALARDHGVRRLHLYRDRACSSLYLADRAIARAFAREEYFELDGSVEVRTMPLDAAAEAYGFADAVYLKVDAQGAELEVLRSGPRLVGESLLVVRAEAAFTAVYHGQPLYADLEAYLRCHGFAPVGFLELHHWRRYSRRNHPELAEGPLPYSRGQLVHGDALFFRDPATLPDATVPGVERLVKAALLALAYEHVDHALALLSRPPVARHLAEVYGLEAKRELAVVSRHLARLHHLAASRRRLRGLLGIARAGLVGRLVGRGGDQVPSGRETHTAVTSR
jgi:FkbM family methyltransferase